MSIFKSKVIELELTLNINISLNKLSEIKIYIKNKQYNPRLSLVNEGIQLCKKEKVDFILAVGGGSVIDSAKAIAIDGLCESTLKTIMRNGLILRKDNKDYDACASHKIEHELSAIYYVYHGAGLAIITLEWMKYVYKENLSMFEQFARNVMGVEKGSKSEEEIIFEGIERLKVFYKNMGLPTNLKELGIDESKL